MKIKKLKTLISVALSVALILASVAVAGVVNVAFADGEFLKGDLNNNGQAGDAGDVSLLRFHLGGDPDRLLTGNALIAANFFCLDDVVDMTDLFYLRRIQLNNEALPTCCPIPEAWRALADERVIFNPREARYVTGHSVTVNQIGYTAGEPKIMRMTEGGNAQSDRGLTYPQYVRLSDMFALTPLVFERPMQPQNSLINNVDVILWDVVNRRMVATYRTGTGHDFPRITRGSMRVVTVDFSDFTTPGIYRFYTPIGRSFDFEIRENPYHDVTLGLVRALYYQRCGIALDSRIVTEGHARPACHLVATGDGWHNPDTDTFHTDNSVARPSNALSRADRIAPVVGNEAMIIDTFDPARRPTGVNPPPGGFVPNRDNNGNILRFPATRFAGGHHDAGDWGRYTTPAAQMLADLVVAWEMYPEVFKEQDDICDELCGGGICENSCASVPDILDEARWMGEFLINMQAIPEDGGPESSLGGFYFKVHTTHFGWGRPEIDPMLAHSGLRVQHVNLWSSAVAAASLAQVGHVFRDIDPDFSQRAIESASKGFDFIARTVHTGGCDVPAHEPTCNCLAGRVIFTEDDLGTRERQLRNHNAPQGLGFPQTGGGAYGGSAGSNDVLQSLWWVAVANYRATGAERYRNFMNNLDTHRKGQNLFTNMSAYYHGGYGTIAYILMDRYDGALGIPTNPTPARVQRAVNSFSNAANDVRVSTNQAPRVGCIFDSIIGDRFFAWGSNDRKAQLLKPTAIMTYLTEANRNAEIRRGISWMLGLNPRSFSMITRFGTKYSQNIHHNPNRMLTGAGHQGIPGMLAGGFTNEGSAWTGINPERNWFYDDRGGDFVSNEMTIYWNSSAMLVFASVVAEDLANMSD